MNAEFQSPEKSIPKSYLKYYGTTVVFAGEIPPYNPGEITIESEVWQVVLELLSNCVENRLPESDAGAKNITVTFEPGKATVEDDFVYEKPEAVLKQILQMRDSERPTTTKHSEDRFPSGGMGLYNSTKTLRKLGGDLDYYVKDGTIVAVATWEVE
jgi:hypothetical protein